MTLARKTVLFLAVFAVLVVILAAGIHTLTRENNLGIDFFIFWQAGQAVYRDHASPYSEDIAVRSQLAIMKRLSKPGEDQLAFVYPPYALLPIYPLALLPFDWAQSVWIAFLSILLVASFALAFPTAPKWAPLSLLAFYPVFFGLILGNFAILITGLLAVLMSGLLRGEEPGAAWQVTAGFAAGWLTVKPQFTWPFLLVLCLYAVRRKYWRLLVAAAGSFALFLGISFLLAPNWPAEWLDRINRYTAYNQAYPIIVFFLKDILSLDTAAWVAGAVGAACIGFSTWLVLRWWRERLDGLVLVAWLGFLGYLFHPRGASYEQLAFLLPLALWACLHPRPRSFAVLGWWISSLVVSWLAFAIAVSVPLVSATEWPMLFHAAWLGWLLWRAIRHPTLHSVLSYDKI